MDKHYGASKCSYGVWEVQDGEQRTLNKVRGNLSHRKQCFNKSGKKVRDRGMYALRTGS